MIVIEQLDQGTDEWREARRGIPTASRFKDIFTSQGKPSSSATSYMDDLLAEWYIGCEEGYTNAAMARGTELEPEARSYYSFINDAAIQQVGLVYLDDRKLIACSPDGLQDGGGLEIKCPMAKTHTRYLRQNKCPAEYVPQVQGSMWVCEREWWDFLSYHPDSPEQFLIRVERDDEFIKGLSETVLLFVDKMLNERSKLKQRAA